MLGSILALFAGVGLKLLEPWPLKWVFDYALAGKKHTGWPVALWFADAQPLTVLFIAAAAILIITSLRALAEYVTTVCFALVGNRVLTGVRNELYRHLQRLSLSYHSKARGGDLTVRVVGDVNMLKDVASTALLPLTANVLILMGMLGLMFWMEWRLALLTLVTLPLYWLSTLKLTQRIREASRKQRAREGELAATVAESLTAIKDVQALSLEDAFADHFADRSKKCLKESVRSSRLAAQLERRVDVIGAIATALVVLCGARMVLSGTMTPGDLIVFLAYLKRSFNPLQDFAKYTGRLAKAAAAGERVLGVLNEQPLVRDLPHAIPAPLFRGEITFDSVSFGYEPGRPILQHIKMALPAGSRVALVGPSGIGKSTMLNLIMRLYDPSEGRVVIDGHDLRHVTLPSLRKQISVVLQDSLLFAASVKDNIAHGVAGATKDEIEAAARLANADEFIAQMPLGYDTVLGERGVTLSHGQRQRLAIARAAIRRAPILLLDEPTTGLDEENERAVVEALHRLSEGRTTILITHDLQMAARADRIIYLENGYVAESGSHQTLMLLEGRYSALYRLQTGSSDAARGGHHHAVAG